MSGESAVDATESAVVVPLSVAEAVVGPHRARLDPASAKGVPAHVTVLYPFVAPEELTEAVFVRLAAALAPFSSFDCTLARTAWFGDEVLWLAPEPDLPFRRMTEAVFESFPDYPPYGGAHADTVPHLTVGDQSATHEELRRAEGIVAGQLPIRCSVTTVSLMTGASSPNSWRELRSFAL